MFLADRELFHFLLDHRADIRRTVKERQDGVETVTESDDPTVALAIQGHVASMRRRVEQSQPIHMRDPLFAAVFASAKLIDIQTTPLPKGIRVTETSKDPYVAKLIQAHARVVSLFVARGYVEVPTNHPVPARAEQKKL